jgi:hypothetical protein
MMRRRNNAVGLFDNFKDLFKLADTVNNIELYKKLSELQTSMYALEEENRALKDEIRRRDEQRSIGDRLLPRDNAYYLDDGVQLDGPFCLRCWDVNGKLVRERAGATAGTHYCEHCRQQRRR